MQRPKLRIWDLPTRLLHGVLVAGVTIAWITSTRATQLGLHRAAGWVLALALSARLVWGLVGTKHARWRTFLAPWRQVRAHLRGILTGGGERSLGHNPVAAWAMLAGLLLLILITLSGALVEGGEENLGPLADAIGVATGGGLHGVHARLAQLLLAWIAVHLLGVIRESVKTRENLALAMVDGLKRPGAETGARPVPARAGAAVVILGGLALACAGPLRPDADQAAADRQVPPPTDPTFQRECGDCHLAWHPSLLPARSWDLLMATQSDHFGEDLGLTPQLAGHIQDFLVNNAAELTQTEAAWRVATLTPTDTTPLRLTETPMWVAAHADISPDTFESAPVRNPGRCQVCHDDAESGIFANQAIHPATPEESL